MGFRADGIVVLMTMAVLCQASIGSTASILDKCKGRRFFPHPGYCAKYYECNAGVPVEMTCPKKTVFSEELHICVTAGSMYDKCTPAHVDRECALKTVDFIPHPISCQGYYNCSSKQQGSLYSRLFANYENECEYPNLFDIVQMKCVKFYQAVCGEGRVAGKWECDYKYNLCPVSMCRPCWVDHAKCVGKKDGLYPIPWKLWSPYYVECYGERSKCGQVACPSGMIFNPEERKCMEKPHYA